MNYGDKGKEIFSKVGEAIKRDKNDFRNYLLIDHENTKTADKEYKVLEEIVDRIAAGKDISGKEKSYFSAIYTHYIKYKIVNKKENDILEEADEIRKLGFTIPEITEEYKNSAMVEYMNKQNVRMDEKLIYCFDDRGDGANEMPMHISKLLDDVAYDLNYHNYFDFKDYFRQIKSDLSEHQCGLLFGDLEADLKECQKWNKKFGVIGLKEDCAFYDKRGRADPDLQTGEYRGHSLDGFVYITTPVWLHKTKVNLDNIKSTIDKGLDLLQNSNELSDIPEARKKALEGFLNVLQKQVKHDVEYFENASDIATHFSYGGKYNPNKKVNSPVVIWDIAEETYDKMDYCKWCTEENNKICARKEEQAKKFDAIIASVSVAQHPIQEIANKYGDIAKLRETVINEAKPTVFIGNGKSKVPLTSIKTKGTAVFNGQDEAEREAQFFKALVEQLDASRSTWHDSPEFNTLVDDLKKTATTITSKAKGGTDKEYMNNLWNVKNDIIAYYKHKAKDGVNNNVLNKLAAVEEVANFVNFRLYDMGKSNPVKFEGERFAVNMNDPEKTLAPDGFKTDFALKNSADQEFRDNFLNSLKTDLTACLGSDDIIYNVSLKQGKDRAVAAAYAKIANVGKTLGVNIHSSLNGKKPDEKAIHENVLKKMDEEVQIKF